MSAAIARSEKSGRDGALRPGFDAADDDDLQPGASERAAPLMSTGRWRIFLFSSTCLISYRGGVDQRTKDRIFELRVEIAALQQENSAYAQQGSHTAAERHTHELRRKRLESIKVDLMRLPPGSTS